MLTNSSLLSHLVTHSLREMLNILPYHGSHFLKIDLITAPFNILHFIKEPFYILSIEITDEFPKERGKSLE